MFGESSLDDRSRHYALEDTAPIIKLPHHGHRELKSISGPQSEGGSLKDLASLSI